MMKKFLLILIVSLLSCVLICETAEARRFGGGRSFGMQRSTMNYSRQANPLMNKSATSPTQRWLSRIGGFALGGLLAYLLMGHGIGAGLISWLIIGGLLIIIANFIRNSRRQTAYQSANHHDTQEGFANNYAKQHYANPQQQYQPGFASNGNVPANFDEEGFIRNAKVQFIRLQAAYDQNNLQDIREFTTPEVFAEIQIQLKENDSSNNQTEVVNLHANLLEVTQEYGSVVASVKFSGLIRENINENAAPFIEIWNFQERNGKWYLAGIQQQ